jgi:hypothetical protein
LLLVVVAAHIVGQITVQDLVLHDQVVQVVVVIFMVPSVALCPQETALLDRVIREAHPLLNHLQEPRKELGQAAAAEPENKDTGIRRQIQELLGPLLRPREEGALLCLGQLHRMEHLDQHPVDILQVEGAAAVLLMELLIY